MFSTQTNPNIPSPRRFATSVVINGMTYVFGGEDATSIKNDLWVFDNAQVIWNPYTIDGPAPSPRYGHCVTKKDHWMVIFGGATKSDYLNDVWAFDTINRVWVKHNTIDDPEPRAFHVCGSQAGYLFAMYGSNTGRLGSVYTLNITDPLVQTPWTLRFQTDYNVHQGAAAQFRNFIIWFGGEVNSGADNSLSKLEVKKVINGNWSNFLRLANLLLQKLLPFIQQAIHLHNYLAMIWRSSVHKFMCLVGEQYLSHCS